MPLYALDEENRIVAARDADFLKRYRCLECKSLMAKRVGAFRRTHFYHLQTTRHCRLHSRSEDHLILQAYLQEKNSALEIERPFQKILRIADLCWEEKKLVFEIQCSPIDQPDAHQRINDYRQEGYELVWLLYDRLYNRRSLRLAELFLRCHAGYFFSLHQMLVYDQFEVIDDQKRLFKGPPLPVNLFRPLAKPSITSSTKQLDARTLKYFFQGDLFDRVLRYPAYRQKIQEKELAVLAEKSQNKNIYYWIRKWFYIGLEFLLDRSTEIQ